MKQGFRENVSLEQAVDGLLRLLSPVDVETVDLEDSVGRVAAADVEAERAVPHYDRAAMDGYALRAEDTHGASETSPVRLDVVERDGDLEAGEAAYVHTGSEVPEGADAVVRVERTNEVADAVEVEVALSEGENVADVGEDVEEGETVVPAGRRIRPSTQAVMRSVGVEDVDVRRRPRVAVVPTGDEVVRSDPAPGEVVGTNGPMVAEYVERWGGTAEVRDVVPDDARLLRDAVSDAVSSADLVATTGGSSVGERDLLPEVVDDVGEMHVHGVAIKPGHPVGFGEVDGTPVVTLPGYPVSCVVNAFELLRPALRALLDHEPEVAPRVSATLTEKLASDVGKRTYTRVTIQEDAGEHQATPVRTSGASVLSSVSDADGFVVTPESREGYPEGAEVDVELWSA
ncbi:MAG: gephyrin-like molybdotransferase Glp [Halobacteriales archaeon]